MVHEKHKIPIYHNTLNLVYDKEMEISSMMEKLGIEDDEMDSEETDGYTFIYDNEYWIFFHNNITKANYCNRMKLTCCFNRMCDQTHAHSFNMNP